MLTKHVLGRTLLTKILILLYLIISIFKKNYIEIDSVRYPRDSVLVNNEQNDYIEQSKDIKLIFREYIGEEILTLFISYPDMKTKHPIEIIDLRHQLGHITPKKIQLFQE